MDTGIGKDGYSIIGQGKIDEILSNKSEDRRHIFEEAAGIVKYRTRKQESEKKMEQTKLNLLRINDILTEIEGNIEPLKAQSEKAKQYLNLREELKNIEVGLFVYNINSYKEKLKQIVQDEEIMVAQKETEDEKLTSIQELKDSLKREIDEIILQIEQMQNIGFESSNKIEKMNSEIGISKERIQNNLNNKERLQIEIQEFETRIKELEEEEKQRQYDEMIELRRQQRKKIQSKGADCTNLKKYQQEVIKIRDFLQITMVILITVLLIWTGLSAEEGERIPILILEFLIDAPLLFFSSKVVTLSKEGCKISYLFFKKMYKWEELEIIREDYFPSFRDRRSRGIVFSKRKKNKAGYIYKTREIVGSGHILECFYIVLDADGNIHLYKRLAAKDGKTKLRKVAVNIPQKLAEWGVEIEKMMKYQYH